MKQFEFIDITTADVAFVAYGKTPNELFANAALAMFDVMIDTKNVEQKTERKVNVNGDDMLSLMFNWLNELLVYTDSENMAFSGFDVRIDEKRFELNAVCRGEKIDEKKHKLRTEVKACTYHQMKIEKNDVWKARVILDV